MQAKIKALQDNHTWELVALPLGKQSISCKWVYRVKYKSNDSMERYKARLVAKDYTQQEGIEYLDIFSPVAEMYIVRVLLAIAVAKGCIIALSFMVILMKKFI